MLNTSNYSNGWRTSLETKKLWENDTHAQYEIILIWETNGTKRIDDKNAKGTIRLDGTVISDETFHAKSSSKQASVFIVSTLQKVEKKSYSYGVKIKGDVTISGYGYPNTISVSDTIRVEAKTNQTLSRPTLEASDSAINSRQSVNLTFKRAESQGVNNFNKFEVIQILPGNKEKIIYSGSSSTWRFTPSTYAKRFLTLKLKEVHYGDESSYSEQIGINISDTRNKVYDRQGGRPTVTTGGPMMKAIVLADFY